MFAFPTRQPAFDDILRGLAQADFVLLAILLAAISSGLLAGNAFVTRQIGPARMSTTNSQPQRECICLFRDYCRQALKIEVSQLVTPNRTYPKT
jgi:hypothetical protein